MKRNLNVFKTICIQLLLFIARLKKNKQMFLANYCMYILMSIECKYKHLFESLVTWQPTGTKKENLFFRPYIIIQNNNWSIKMLIKTFHTLRILSNFNHSLSILFSFHFKSQISLIFKYFSNSKYADKKIFCIYI